jgi:hypothetical protein
LDQIATFARSHGIQQYSWEQLSDFVCRVLQQFDSHPDLARDITINVFNITPPTPQYHPASGSAAITVGKTALWAVRVGLMAFGIYSFF